MRLTLLHFNDLHGRLDQLPRLFTLIQRERAEARTRGVAVLLLDAGDSSERKVWESDITKGRANFALLEAMGVQASVVGNGEALQWGRAALERLVASVHFPVLAANLVDMANPDRLAVPGLKSSLVLEIEGHKIGLVGVTAIFRGGYDRFGYISIDPRPVLRREIANLQSQGARTLILLSHLGCVLDPANKRADVWGDEDVPADCPEIDVIVGGHTDAELDPPVRVGNAVIAQAGHYGQYLGRLDLDLDDETGRVRDFFGRLIPCDDRIPPDPTIGATLDLVREEAAHLFDAQVGVAARDLPHCFDQPSPFANRVADALRDLCHADLAIFFEGFAFQGLKAGPITRRDLYEALPGSTHVTAAEVSGAQIRRMVERMLASKYRTESFDPKRGEPPLGLPACSSNVQLKYQLPDHQLTECLIDGRPLDPVGRYRLASTFFTLSPITDDPEYDYAGLEPGQRVENIRVEEVLWEIVEDWVRSKGSV
jgi:5'-nucleotidase